jgi:hypothetical protein
MASRPIVTFALLTLSLAGGAHAAQYIVPVVRSVDAKSGAPVLVGVFVDCRSHSPYEGLPFVQHGKVTMRRQTGKQCGNVSEPITAYWYVSDPGFKGMDEVNFSLVSGSAMIVHVNVH